MPLNDDFKFFFLKNNSIVQFILFFFPWLETAICVFWVIGFEGTKLEPNHSEFLEFYWNLAKTGNKQFNDVLWRRGKVRLDDLQQFQESRLNCKCENKE